MDTKAVIQLLEAHQNEKGMQKWIERYQNKGLKSYGIGLTVLRKLAKQVGRNHTLALELWESDNYDIKIMGLLIDDPKLMTPEQAEMQVEELKQGHLAHVFSSCDAALAKTSFAAELSEKWRYSEDKIRKSCSYGLIYELSKSKKKSAPDTAFFLECIQYIEAQFPSESLYVQGAMGGALLGIGKRNLELHTKTLKLAKVLGPIHFETSSPNCEPLDLVKHLTSDYLKKKLGIV